MIAQVTDETVANFRTLFSKVRNSENWKLPTEEFVSFDAVEAFEMKEAITFFVGGAEVQIAEVPVRHPDGLVTFFRKGYIVTSKGYYHYVGA